MTIVFLLGPSGSGKSTLARWIKEDFDYEPRIVRSTFSHLLRDHFSPSNRSAGCPDLVAHSGLEAHRPTCLSVGGKQHCQNCTRFLLSRHGGRPPCAFHLLSLVGERGKSFSYYANTSFALQPLRLGTDSGTTSFQSCRFNPSQVL